MSIRYLNAQVSERTRQGRRKPERTCACDAAPYPHRVGSVKGCYGDLVCYHGRPMYGHPDYDGSCPECDREEYADLQFDLWHDEHGLQPANPLMPIPTIRAGGADLRPAIS